MAEILTLATPVVRVAVNGFTISRIALVWEAPSHVTVDLLGDDGVERRSFAWTGAEAVVLLTAFNVVNLSTKSLHKRVFERLISDGYLSGTITGVPN